MERRSFVQAAGLTGLAGALAAGAAPAVHAQVQTRWRMGPGTVPGFCAAADATVQLARRVAEMTGGGFQIDMLADSTAAMPSSRAIDAAVTGHVEIVHVATADLIARDEAFAFGAGMPFGLDARQMDAWLLSGSGEALMRTLHAEHGLVNLPGGHTGAPLGGWFHRPLARLDDLRGLRLQAGGITGQVLERLGAVTAARPAVEARSALQDGGLDAGLFAGPHDDLQMGLHRSASHCAYPAFGDGDCRFAFLVNPRAHAALPRQHQAVLEAAARQVHADILDRYDMLNPVALRKLVAAGTRLFRLPQDALDAAFEESQAVCAELCARNPAFRTLWADQRKVRADLALWQRFAAPGFDPAAIV